MIILNLKDGLGNQLFEYAYARQIQKLTGERIAINTFFFCRTKDRQCSLNHYSLNKNVRYLKIYEQWIYTSFFYIRLFLCLGYKRTWQWVVKKNRPDNDNDYEEYAKRGLYYSFVTFNDCGYYESKKKIKFIHGNFESCRYLNGILDVLRQEFSLYSELTMQQKNILAGIQNSESVCVHIRRGDYLNPKWSSFNVCDFDYYNRAINYIHNIIPDSSFFVFSNTIEDIRWIKDNYPFDHSEKIIFVECDSADYQDFELMRNCNHFIISNSTYSWWAANLSKNIKKMVIAPEIWSLGNQDTSNMYLKNWIVLSQARDKQLEEGN